MRRCKLLKSHFYSKSVEYNYHAPDLSRLEAVVARGDRRLGAVIEEAARRGAVLDGWDEYFSYQTIFKRFYKSSHLRTSIPLILFINNFIA